MSGLSDREREVVALVAEGLTNEDIAERLYIDLSTVKSHLSRIGAKANTRSRAALVNWAWQNNILGDRAALISENERLTADFGRLHATCTTAEEADGLRNTIDNLQAMYRTACGFQGWVPS